MIEHTAIIGSQWGDEGKGKISDCLSRDYDVSCRFSGGDNAAHTVVRNGARHVFRILPAAALNAKRILLTAHVVFDPLLLAQEIARYSQLVENFTLIIDHRAHLALSYHREIDGALERWRGALPLRSTRRGIGPCCADRTDRLGIRAGDLLNLRLLRERLEHITPLKASLLSQVLGTPATFTAQTIYSEVASCARALVPYIGDATKFFTTHSNQLTFLFEGAQGTLLDNSHGLYPFVAGYSTIAAAIFPSLGVPTFPLRSIGVTAAYTTQIGNAPFPTEQANALGRLLQSRGNEYSSTGYLRRCGWLDLNMVKYSAAANGFRELALTKLDVLDEFDELPVCVGYELDENTINTFPNTVDSLRRCIPVYKTLPGWRTPTQSVSQFAALPRKAKRFVEFVEEAVGIPISFISTGPDRQDIIQRPLC